MTKIAISVALLTAALLFSACSGSRQNVSVSDPAAQAAPAEAASSETAPADKAEATGEDKAEGAPAGQADAQAAGEAQAAENSPGDAESQAANLDTPKIILEPPAYNADDLPPDVIHCEVKLDHPNGIYTAQSFGPTLEEARDNTVEEACALPCAENIAKDLSDDEAESELNACAEKCAMKAIVLAAACIQHGKPIYTEGAWSETNDPAPTNGEEVPAE